MTSPCELHFFYQYLTADLDKNFTQYVLQLPWVFIYLIITCMKQRIKQNMQATRLSTLSSAATGQVGFCCFSHVNTLLKDAAQTLRAVQVGSCQNGES